MDMDQIYGFLADHYIIFAIISVALLFAIIGFVVGGKKKNKKEVETADAVDQSGLPETVTAFAAGQKTEIQTNTNVDMSDAVPSEPLNDDITPPTLDDLKSEATMDAEVDDVSNPPVEGGMLVIEDKPAETAVEAMETATPEPTVETVETPTADPIEQPTVPVDAPVEEQQTESTGSIFDDANLE